METFLEKTLLGFCFMAFSAGLILHLVVFFRLLWESRSDAPNLAALGKLMAIGDRSIQLVQASLIVTIVMMICMADGTFSPGRYITLLVLGYCIAWTFWVPLKLVHFMASGGLVRMTAKLFPQSPA